MFFKQHEHSVMVTVETVVTNLRFDSNFLRVYLAEIIPNDWAFEIDRNW